MSDFIPAIDREIAELRAQLAADPRHQKIEALLRLRAMYVGPSPLQAEDVSNAAQPRPPHRRPEPKPRGDPERRRMLDEIEQVLGDKPTSTSDIYEYLVVQGFHIGGKDPKNNLSAMLSNSGRFQAHGRAGWTRKQAQPTGGGVAQPHEDDGRLPGVM